MGDAHFEALKLAKQENYDLIYLDKKMAEFMDQTVFPMMKDIYEEMLKDLENENKSSPIYKHHIDFLNNIHYERQEPYENSEKNQIVVDYIASMTDDYFIDLHKHLFPNSKYSIEYKSYFD